MKTVDVLAQRLALAGCRYAFGMPGGEVLTLLEALRAAGIGFHMAKHENAAGFMAEGTSHRTGAPGILLATIGPGAANCINVAANALQDRVPLVILTGCLEDSETLTYTHQIMDHQAVFRPVVKASFKLTAKNVNVLADKALRIALDGRPGPVHIDVPMAVAEQASEERAEIRNSGPRPVGPLPGPDLEAARGWLAEAERPVMIAGVDVLNQGAAQQVAAVAQRFNIPLITSYKAKGVLPEDHPLALGGAGLSPLADGQLLPLISEADVVLLVGYDPIEMRSGWRDPWDLQRQKVIDLVAAPNHHDMHRASLEFVGDCGLGLQTLCDGLTPRATWPDGRPAAVRAALRQDFGQGEEWGPTAVIEEVRAALPRDALATVDSGAHRILLSQIYDCYEEKGLNQSTGLCTMGCALPLAIGQKLADPGRPVVALTGDAGLLMVLGELSTLAELKLPVVVVVFLDANLALIDLKQRRMQLPNVGVHLDGVDFSGIARSFGGLGLEAGTRAELKEAMEAALKAERFSIITCHIERQTYEGRL
ncbi:MAG: thiamine pyrophosphate-binding protein [Pseudomonadota bacterium]